MRSMPLDSSHDLRHDVGLEWWSAEMVAMSTSIVGMLYEINACGGSRRWKKCWLWSWENWSTSMVGRDQEEGCMLLVGKKGSICLGNKHWICYLEYLRSITTYYDPETQVLMRRRGCYWGSWPRWLWWGRLLKRQFMRWLWWRTSVWTKEFIE